MEQLKPFSPEFEQNIGTALTVWDDQEEEFLMMLKKQILAEHSPQPARQRPFSARLAWGAAIVLLVIMTIFLAIGPQRVLAAVRGWLGYIPGIGFVETETTLRVLATPIEQEREGITVTIEQVVADAQRTVIVFKVEGLGPQHRPDAEDAPRCVSSPFLRMPDGRELSLTGGEGEGWPSGYRTRMIFPAIPQNENRPTLVIPCLDDTRPGAAPEDWVFELALQPAPPDFQPLPVIELPISPASTPSDTVSGAAQPAIPLAPTPSADPHGIHFQVEKLVELEDGYLLQGSLDWQGTEFDLAGFNPYYLQVRDAAGQTIPIEPVRSEQSTGNPYADKRQTWMVRTASKQYAGPLTLTLPTVGIDQQVEVFFKVDLGADPQPGQTWELNQTLEVAGRRVTVTSVSLAASTVRGQEAYGLSFTLHADPEQLSFVSLSDPDNRSALLSSNGGSDRQGTIQHKFNYDYLPTGQRRILISQVGYPLSGPWVVTVDLPPTSAPAAPLPTQPAACLTPERLAQLQAASPASLPAGLGGRLLIFGPAAEGVHFPTLYLTDLDGANKVTLGPGGWADLSPDRTQVVYAFSDGMHLVDLASGQNLRLPWAQENDYNPLWSPDRAWIAFERSNDGIYITRPDGSGLRKVQNVGVSTFLAGWQPDGKGLVVSTQGAEGSVLQTVDPETGAVKDHFMIDNRKGDFSLPSPDGLHVAYREKVFGRPQYGIYIANLDGSQKRLVAILDEAALTAAAWSPDGHWLLVTASEAMLDGSKETNYLVQPDTCEVIPLTWIEDAVASWR